ncbi:MAG: gluconokinase [Burkholderiaceae bacterium]
MSFAQSPLNSDQELLKPDVPRFIVVMGVSGAGKSTIGEAIAARLGTSFIDGDSYHPRANVEKMSRGEALTDRDRMPWLALIAGAMRGHVARSEQAFKKLEGEGSPAPIPEGCSVAACSALRRSYREYLAQQAGEAAFFVFLEGTKEIIHSRMLNREGHFMPSQLLDSQFAALEPLASDEYGITLDVNKPVDELVDSCLEKILSGRSTG